VTAHVTYLQNGRKLSDHEPRKILTKLEGRTGCAVRLMPLRGDLLGIGEGLETMLAAHRLHGIPTWSALNTALLAKFEPPESVRALIVFADRDIAGLEAACRLFERLQGRVHLELRVPSAPAKDWNDVLLAEVSPKRRLRTEGRA
jgi:putative DNA primase/helicase